MDKIVIGRVEKVRVNDKEFLAKIDTGAYINSICGSIVKKLDLKPTRRARIRNAQGSYMRDVIEAELTIKGRKFKTEFSVADRSDLKYDILIGRKILKGNFLVDPSIKNETGSN